LVAFVVAGFGFGEREKMLSIKRVPTVVSNYQKDEDAPVSGCGRNCLKSCCIKGSVFNWWLNFMFCLCFLFFNYA
jgi:hypothetical protein